ncbi:hypothetical protein [Microbulbifer sp. JMSA003]|uniref:hypothetical protein n=1 Tax=unclassified Microbulbifer TaxID=2619833 RepID=UPI004039EA63
MADKSNFLSRLFTPIEAPESFVQQHLKGYGSVSTLLINVVTRSDQREITDCLDKLYDLVALTTAPHPKRFYLEKIEALREELTGVVGRKALYKRLEVEKIPFYIHFDSTSVCFIANHDFFSGYTGLLFSKYANCLLKKDQERSDAYCSSIVHIYKGNGQYSNFHRVIGLAQAIFIGLSLRMFNRKESKPNPFLLEEKGCIKGDLDDIVLVSAKVESSEISFENVLKSFIDNFVSTFERQRANILITQEFIHNIPDQGERLAGVGNTASGFYFSLNKLSRYQIYLLKRYHIAYYAMVLLNMLKVEKQVTSSINEDFTFSYLPAREVDCIATYSITRDALVFVISKASDGYHIEVAVNEAIFSLDKVVLFLKSFSSEIELSDI